MIRRPPRSTLDRSSAASDVYKRQGPDSPLVRPRPARPCIGRRIHEERAIRLALRASDIHFRPIGVSQGKSSHVPSREIFHVPHPIARNRRARRRTRRRIALRHTWPLRLHAHHHVPPLSLIHISEPT